MIVIVVSTKSVLPLARNLTNYFESIGKESVVINVCPGMSALEVQAREISVLKERKYKNSWLDHLIFEVLGVKGVGELPYADVVVSLCGNPFGPGKFIINYYRNKGVPIVRYAQGVYSDHVRFRYYLYAIYNFIRLGYLNSPSHFSGFSDIIYTPWKVPEWGENLFGKKCEVEVVSDLQTEFEVQGLSRAFCRKRCGILLLGQLGFEKELVEASEALISFARNRSIPVWFRPHPRSELTPALRAILEEKQINISTGLTLCEEALKSQMAVSLFSTSLLQSASLGCLVAAPKEMHAFLEGFRVLKGKLYSLESAVNGFDEPVNNERLSIGNVGDNPFINRVIGFLPR